MFCKVYPETSLVQLPPQSQISDYLAVTSVSNPTIDAIASSFGNKIVLKEKLKDRIWEVLTFCGRQRKRWEAPRIERALHDLIAIDQGADRDALLRAWQYTF